MLKYFKLAMTLTIGLIIILVAIIGIAFGAPDNKIIGLLELVLTPPKKYTWYSDWWSHAYLNFLTADFIRYSKQNFAALSLFY